MKLKNTGRNPIGLRYGTHTKGKKGEPGTYKDHLVVIDPGQEAELPDELDHISIQKVERPKSRRGIMQSMLKGETKADPRSQRGASN